MQGKRSGSELGVRRWTVEAVSEEKDWVVVGGSQGREYWI